jgi:hypothetical protein
VGFTGFTGFTGFAGFKIFLAAKAKGFLAGRPSDRKKAAKRLELFSRPAAASQDGAGRRRLGNDGSKQRLGKGGL